MLIIIHYVAGNAPLPWGDPWTKGIYVTFLLLIVKFEPPNDVQIWCFIFWMFWKMHCMGCCSIAKLWYVKLATEWITLPYHGFALLEHTTRAPLVLRCLMMSNLSLFCVVHHFDSSSSQKPYKIWIVLYDSTNMMINVK